MPALAFEVVGYNAHASQYGPEVTLEFKFGTQIMLFKVARNTSGEVRCIQQEIRTVTEAGNWPWMQTATEVIGRVQTEVYKLSIY